jgi:hypothetical protein
MICKRKSKYKTITKTKKAANAKEIVNKEC